MPQNMPENDENTTAEAEQAAQTEAEERLDWYGDDVATLGDRIAAAREAAGLSSKKLARRLGVKHATVQDWEADLSEPRANRLSMMAGLLNVSIMWLLTGDGDGISGPEGTTEIPADVNDILLEIRDVKSGLAAASDRLARLEKKLRQTLKEG